MKKQFNLILAFSLLLCVGCSTSFNVKKVSIKIDNQEDIGLSTKKGDPYLLVDVVSEKNLIKVKKDYILQIRNNDESFEAFGTLYQEERQDIKKRLKEGDFETKKGPIHYTLRFDRLSTFLKRDSFVFEFYIIGVNKAPGWWPTSNIITITSDEFYKALKEYNKRKTEPEG